MDGSNVCGTKKPGGQLAKVGNCPDAEQSPRERLSDYRNVRRGRQGRHGIWLSGLCEMLQAKSLEETDDARKGSAAGLGIKRVDAALDHASWNRVRFAKIICKKERCDVRWGGIDTALWDDLPFVRQRSTVFNKEVKEPGRCDLPLLQLPWLSHDTFQSYCTPMGFPQCYIRSDTTIHHPIVQD
jgi:hypothetical protein